MRIRCKNKQSRNFAAFLLAAAAATSFIYHITNPDQITLASAVRLTAAGRHLEALPLYEELADKNFRPDTVYIRLAECYFSLERPEDAREALISAGRRDDPRVLRMLAGAGLWLGLFQDSAGEYREALELAPGDRAARFGLARALAWSGNFEEAVREYRLILEGE